MEEKKNHIGKDKKENKENKKQIKSISQRDLAKELALKFGMNISVIEGIIEEEQKLTMLYQSALVCERAVSTQREYQG